MTNVLFIKSKDFKTYCITSKKGIVTKSKPKSNCK